MSRWSGIVVASAAAGDGMMSRLPAYLHPVSGRPLIWHTVAALARHEPAPERVVVVAGTEVPDGLFSDLGHARIELVGHDALGDLDLALPGDGSAPVLVVDASAPLPASAVDALRSSPRGSWLAAGDAVAAARLDARLAPEVLRLPHPLQSTRGVLTPSGRLEVAEEVVVVRDRSHLARVSERVRGRIVYNHMCAGVTFLLPETTLVDVDVRIGTDTVIYPGVVLEGETNVGAETVIGPGCRIIDSWIGSGVELKGWNYVAHTSVRNRAILEPYVRRGFD